MNILLAVVFGFLLGVYFVSYLVVCAIHNGNKILLVDGKVKIMPKPGQ